MTYRPALPPGIALNACYVAPPSALSDAILGLLCRTHATQVALMRHYDAQPSDAPLARYHACWAGDAMREARRIRTELRAHGSVSLADRLAWDAYGIVPVTPNDGAAA